MSEVSAPQHETVEMAVLRIAKDQRHISFARLSADTGIPETTIRSYANGQNGFGWDNARKIIRALPADLGSLLIEDTGYRLAPLDPRAAGWLELGEKCATFAGKTLRYQATGGHIDHIEDADLRQDMLIILSDGQGAVQS